MTRPFHSTRLLDQYMSFPAHNMVRKLQGPIKRSSSALATRRRGLKTFCTASGLELCLSTNTLCCEGDTSCTLSTEITFLANIVNKLFYIVIIDIFVTFILTQTALTRSIVFEEHITIVDIYMSEGAP